MDGVRGRQALAGNNEGEAAIKNLELKQTKGARLEYIFGWSEKVKGRYPYNKTKYRSLYNAVNYRILSNSL